MPLVSEPFAQVAIDIIGPLPVCQESGNRFILTVLDLCTHYPEAILLKQHTDADVDQALGTVFSRFGFPQETLSDQGSDFMSELMQLFLNEFLVHHIRTCLYHLQSNGACERFNGTLKTMIRSLLDRFPDSWTLLCHGSFLHTVKFPSRPWPYRPRSAAVSEVCLAARD